MTGINTTPWVLNSKTLLVELYELVLDWERVERLIAASLDRSEPYTERETLYEVRHKTYDRIEEMGFHISSHKNGTPNLFPLFLPRLPQAQEEGDDDA